MFLLTNSTSFRTIQRSFKNTYRHTVISGLLLGATSLFIACNDETTVPATPTTETLRQNATSFYQALYSPAQTGVDGFVGAGYIEHQAEAGFTLAGLKSYALTRTANKLVILRALVSNKLVGLHIQEPITADSSVARMAMFRFDNSGRIVEHWEAVQGQPRQRANAHTMFDGPGVNYQSTAGIRGIDGAVAADQQAFNNLDTLAVRQSRALGYIQHNPTIADGASGLIQLILFLKSAGIKIARTSYQRLAEGDCVMTISGTQITAGAQPPTSSLVFDLTRLDDTGKDTEHWDVIEPVSSANVSKAF